MHRLSSRRPLVLSSCRPLVLSSSSHCTALSLSHLTGWLLRRLSPHHTLVVLSLRRSRRLAPAGCCVASRCATLSSCCPLVFSSSSHCAAPSLSHLTGWLLRRLSSHRPLVVLSLRRSLVVLRRLVVASPLLAPPSRPLVVPTSRPLVVLSLRRPLVVSSHRLVVASPLAAPPSRRPFTPPLSSSCAGWLLRRLSSRRPLVVPPSRPLLVLSLRRHLVV